MFSSNWWASRGCGLWNSIWTLLVCPFQICRCENIWMSLIRKRARTHNTLHEITHLYMHLHRRSCGGAQKLMGFRISQFVGTIWSRMTTAHSSGPKGHADVREMAWILNVTPSSLPLPLLFLCLSYPSHDFVIFPVDKTGPCSLWVCEHFLYRTWNQCILIMKMTDWRGNLNRISICLSCSPFSFHFVDMLHEILGYFPTNSSHKSAIQCCKSSICLSVWFSRCCGRKMAWSLASVINRR